LTPHTAPAGLHADGSDLALVDVEIVDAKGHECPVVSPMVTFHLTGPAEWRGGIAQGSSSQVLKNTKTNDNHGLSTTPPTPLLYEDNYILATTLPAENGINRVSIRALPLAGSKHGVIRLTAESPGLSPATITLHSIPVPDDHGLSTYDPIADLPSFVLRGPTPPGSSVRPSRISLAITGAVAGSNSDRAALSFDDNESTSWSNDGQLSTAWIEYTLAKRSAPTQIELKLNAFRTRRYPLRITLDGTTVYEGTTPNSLGYVAIPLQKREGEVVSGTHLRIALTASPIDGTQATGTAEITGKYDGAGVSPVVTDGKATLNIIEVDIYEDSFLNHIQ
jgi:beta-galactosidase